ESAPADPAMVRRQIEGLRRADRDDEARSALLAARFRNPRDPRFHKLWTDFQFEELRRYQHRQHGEGLDATGNGPVLLPFVSVARPAKRTPVRKILRPDPPSAPADPRSTAVQ